MNACVDKIQVEKQFSRAARSYNSAAQLQQQMSDQLIDRLQAYTQSMAIRRITDLGCGTGLSLKNLSCRYPDAELTAVDLSPMMLAEAKRLVPGAQLLCRDMEEHIGQVPQDLIFSNASIQWCELEKTIDKCYKSLKNKGILCFSSFGPSTHKQLAEAWQNVDSYEHRIDFLDAHTHCQILEKQGFQILEQESRLVHQQFNSTQALLASIKKTGATNASRNRHRGLLSKARYQKFLAELGKQQPLLLSYETLSFIAQKVGP